MKSFSSILFFILVSLSQLSLAALRNSRYGNGSSHSFNSVVTNWTWSNSPTTSKNFANTSRLPHSGSGGKKVIWNAKHCGVDPLGVAEEPTFDFTHPDFLYSTSYKAKNVSKSDSPNRKFRKESHSSRLSNFREATPLNPTKLVESLAFDLKLEARKRKEVLGPKGTVQRDQGVHFCHDSWVSHRSSLVKAPRTITCEAGPKPFPEASSRQRISLDLKIIQSAYDHGRVKLGLMTDASKASAFERMLVASYESSLKTRLKILEDREHSLRMKAQMNKAQNMEPVNPEKRASIQSEIHEIKKILGFGVCSFKPRPSSSPELYLKGAISKKPGSLKKSCVNGKSRFKREKRQNSRKKSKAKEARRKPTSQRAASFWSDSSEAIQAESNANQQEIIEEILSPYYENVELIRTKIVVLESLVKKGKDAEVIENSTIEYKLEEHFQLRADIIAGMRASNELLVLEADFKIALNKLYKMEEFYGLAH